MSKKEEKELELQEELPEIELDFDEPDLETELVEPEQEDDILGDLSVSLGQQVSNELEEKKEEVKIEKLDKDSENDMGQNKRKKTIKKKKKGKALKILGIIGILLLLFVAWVVFTPSGQRFAVSIIAKYIDGNIGRDEIPTPGAGTPIPTRFVPEQTNHRAEEYVKNFLIFGIEDVKGARNTDTIMLASVNTKDDTIKLTSILRDTYVEIPGHNPNKLNSVYAVGGIDMMKYVISKTFDVEISGYAYVYFDSFESIIDEIGGIDIELGSEEAAYLNKEGYITNPANRGSLKAGWNHMNGNQVVGYCRVRYVKTLGGANNDFGRTVRQRRVLTAIFNQYKSLSVFDMIPVMTKCLGYVKTDLNSTQITDLLYDIVNNGITKIEEFRVPVDGYYWDSQKGGIGGVKYTMVMKDYLGLTGRDINYLEDNQRLLHEFLFLDEAKVVSGANDVTTPTIAPATVSP